MGCNLESVDIIQGNSFTLNIYVTHYNVDTKVMEPYVLDDATNAFVRLVGNNGVVRKFPDCDYELYPKSDWAFGFDSDKLKFGFTKTGAIPFSEKDAPAYITVKLAPVEWGFLRGYTTIADRWPTHRKALGEAKEFRLIPYGCTKLRMTELPKIKK